MDFTETENQRELAGLARKIFSARPIRSLAIGRAAADSGGASLRAGTTERPEPSASDAGFAGSAADGGSLGGAGTGDTGADEGTRTGVVRTSDTGSFDAALWKDLADAGILAAALPESLGGSGLGLVEQCSVLVEAGRAVAPVPYLASIVLGAGTIARFGTREQQEKWVVPAGRGELIITAALEEEDGTVLTRGDDLRDSRPIASDGTGRENDPASPFTWAMPTSNGGWTLSGTKTTVPYAPLAQLILVPAATPDGVRVFLVDPGAAGVTIESQQLTDFASAGRVTLNGVTVGVGDVLGDAPAIGDGSPAGDASGSAVGGGSTAGGSTAGDASGSAANWLAGSAIVGLCAHQAGVAARALDLTAEYAKTREQFGKPIGAFQAVAQRLADAYVDVQAIQLTMWQAAWRLAAGLPAATEIATAKFWAADGGHRVAHTAVHVHGGVGIDTEGQVHRYFTAAKQNEFTLGGATAQLLRVGTALAQA
jgi:acyl-CoA dehydrogenase